MALLPGELLLLSVKGQLTLLGSAGSFSIYLLTAERKWVMRNLKVEHSKQGVYKWLASKGRSAAALQVWACSTKDGTEIIPAECLWLQEHSYHPSSPWHVSDSYQSYQSYQQWGWSQVSLKNAVQVIEVIENGSRSDPVSGCTLFTNKQKSLHCMESPRDGRWTWILFTLVQQCN